MGGPLGLPPLQWGFDYLEHRVHLPDGGTTELQTQYRGTRPLTLSGVEIMKIMYIVK